MFFKFFARVKQSGVTLSQILIALLIAILIAIEVLGSLKMNFERLSREAEAVKFQK